ncbi:SHOCT domain-containing protein [Alkaliphilus transvaalensis]|uniref:SHOCT domain-containing protein n=1 Tax=Alkaliphilus transvaalensis TaxID=114628 RepID=UPI0009FE2A6F|nr:SHOCT domain-containing protein [Alkaliphilus transvaalensis]
MNHNEEKKVTKLTDESIEGKVKLKAISTEQLQREFDYLMAEKLLRKMQEKGLITEGELQKINELNRQTFSPSLAKIMP